MASRAAAVRISPLRFPRYSNSRWRSRVSHLHESAVPSCAVGIDSSWGPSPESGHVVNLLATGRTPFPPSSPSNHRSSRGDQRRSRCAAAPLDVKWISLKRRRDSSSHIASGIISPRENASSERLSTLRRGSDTVCGHSRSANRACIPDYPELFSPVSVISAYDTLPLREVADSRCNFLKQITDKCRLRDVNILCWCTKHSNLCIKRIPH